MKNINEYLITEMNVEMEELTKPIIKLISSTINFKHPAAEHLLIDLVNSYMFGIESIYNLGKRGAWEELFNDLKKHEKNTHIQIESFEKLLNKLNK